MASAQNESIFEKLQQRADPAEQEKRQQEANKRIHAQYEKSQHRVSELLDFNSTLPVTISSIQVLHATHTRRSFLEPIFRPLLSRNQDDTYTLSEAIAGVSNAAAKLSRFEIFKEPISIFVDKPDPSDPSTSPTDLSIFLSAKERPRYTIKTGTEAGHAEGSAYASAVFRNLFGGAESLNLHGSLGTRTRSAYSGNFETPLLFNPDFRFELGGLATSTLKSWASHEEVVKGGSTKLKWRSGPSTLHELGYSGLWRQVTGLAEKASPTIRQDAGDSFKSSVTYSLTHDTRDIPLLPSSGLLVKTTAELAGVGPLQGDVGFFKPEAEIQGAIPLVSKTSGISFVTGFRTGLLYPLAAGGSALPTQSRISDRFQLGGPTDVRGFRLSGLGPRDGPDAVGGDVYAAGSAALLFPFPRSGPETPLRFQAFINAGRLVALRKKAKGKMSSDDVQRSVTRAIKSLTEAPPSCSAGFGIVYAHPLARFELNFSLPLIVWEGDQARKGVSFGVGISFM